MSTRPVPPAALIVFVLCIPFSTLAGRAASHDDAQERPDPPNVLWIVTDDHAPYVTGAYGNAIVRTPNLDRLAASGMRLDRAYCNSPVCTASRQSFLTGRYPRTIGVTLLRTPLPEAETTLAEMLGAAGYQTASIGKMHFNSALKHGFDLRVDHPEHRRWLRERGRRPLPEGVEVLPPWKPFVDPARLWLNGIYVPYGAWDAEMAGTFFAQEGAKFLAQKREKPFFLMVSFYEPHSPFRFPVEYRDRHDPARFELPRIGPEDEQQIPAVFRDLTDAEKQRINAAYYTSTEFADKNVGIVLDALEESGHADDTLVVYLGDHGYFLGHHGRFEKHSSYEEAARAPLMFRFPGRIEPGTSTQALVEFIDVVPTVLDFSGVAKPENVQGRSLVDLLTGKTDRHREQVFVEYAQNDEVMIRDDRYKLVFTRGKRARTDGYATGLPPQGPTFKLFDLDLDLSKDPGEFINLADRPEHRDRVDRYVALLADFLKRTSRLPDLIPKTDDPLTILDHCVQPRDVEPVKNATP
ncbi:MAG: sulfatase [Planctomycetota bacterium]